MRDMVIMAVNAETNRAGELGESQARIIRGRIMTMFWLAVPLVILTGVLTLVILLLTRLPWWAALPMIGLPMLFAGLVLRHLPPALVDVRVGKVAVDEGIAAYYLRGSRLFQQGMFALVLKGGRIYWLFTGLVQADLYKNQPVRIYYLPRSRYMIAYEVLGQVFPTPAPLYRSHREAEAD